MSSTDPPADSSENQPRPDSLPVQLDDAAVDSMEGQTMASDSGIDQNEAARIASSPSQGAMGKKRQADRPAGVAPRGFSYLKALFIFLFVQCLIVFALGALFRKPLAQGYRTLVERGFIEPNSLPWQGGTSKRSGESSVAEVEWKDVRHRHELTLLADAAIARADRAALDELRGLLDIDDNPMRRAAARAEVFRVQQMYASASASPEELSITDIYPSVTLESELTEEQIIKILADQDRSPEWRVHAAELLEGRLTLEATDALVLAMRNEGNLDVIKAAMDSFKSNTGYPGADFFDSTTAEKWWADNASRLAGEFQKSASTTTATPPKADASSAPAVAEDPAPAATPQTGSGNGDNEQPAETGADPPAKAR